MRLFGDQRTITEEQNREYQCIKALVALFYQCPQVRSMLEVLGTWPVEWLHGELERWGGHRALHVLILVEKLVQ